MKKALLYLFAFLFIQFFAAWAVYAIWIVSSGGSIGDIALALNGKGESAITASMIITGSAVCSVITVVLFLWRKWAVVSPAWLKKGNWDVLFWSAIISLGTLLPSVWLQDVLPELPDAMGDTFKMIMHNPFGYLMICLFAPLVEELVFRGAILKSLLKVFKNHWVAILISAAFFALVHGNPAQMPHAFLIGLLLGWMYYRSGSILPGVTLHWVNNTAAYVTYMLFPAAADMKLIEVYNGDYLRLTLSLVISVCILLICIYQLNRRLRR
ncbi:MAG: CPBP family intramembrane metalloprotease [Prevotella sp.]|nr:CPBP family intramembrane metalloprotease [Prevotella sp.]